MAKPNGAGRPGALPRFALGALSVVAAAYAAWRLGESRRAAEIGALGGGLAPSRSPGKAKRPKK